MKNRKRDSAWIKLGIIVVVMTFICVKEYI